MNNKNAIKKITYYALVGLLITLSILFNVFIQRVQVSGHSMDPTLKTNEKLFAVKHIPIDRFDIVVAKEKTDTALWLITLQKSIQIMPISILILTT